MVKHLATCKENKWGGHNYGTLCRRSNRLSKDDCGNKTDVEAEVTCKFCLRMMPNMAKAHHSTDDGKAS